MEIVCKGGEICSYGNRARSFEGEISDEVPEQS